MLKAFLLDDEPLALDRLTRLIEEDGRVQVVGCSSDPVEAVEKIEELRPDLLFLDIQMPELDGFGVLEQLKIQPLVVFATAFDQHALRAFETNGVAYLLKPVEMERLRQAVDKVLKIRGGQEAVPDVAALLQQIQQRIPTPVTKRYIERVGSKIGDRVELIDLDRVTHFYAEEKLTFAATDAKTYIVDQTIAELEHRVNPEKFLRIHRSYLVNLEFVGELYTYFGGKLILRLKDGKKTELTVARDRVKDLRDRLGV